MMIFLTAILVIVAFVIGVLVGRILKMSFGCPSQDKQSHAAMNVKSAASASEADVSDGSVSTAASSASLISSDAKSQDNGRSKTTSAKTSSTAKSGKTSSSKPKAAAAKKSSANKTAAKTTKTAASTKTASKKASVAKTSAPASKAKSKVAPAKAVTASSGAADDLKLIKGVGKLNETRLHEEGITSFAQIAAWKKADIAEFDDKLNFKGRIERDEWVPQAKVLAKGSSAAKPAAAKKTSAAKAKTASTTKAAAAKKAPVKKVASKSPAKKAAPKPKAVKKPSVPDDLKLIKGVGKLIETKLAKEGITTYSQIAAWKKADVIEFDEKLSFKGRIDRDEWIKQAKVLAKGGTTEFSKRAAKGDVPSSS